MTTFELLTTYFEDELSQISNDYIKEFVFQCFDKFCPEYFWIVPASTSGKYHPKESLGEQGLIRHVKKTVYFGIELWKSLYNGIDITTKDLIIACLLLHDIIKNGNAKFENNNWIKEENSTENHGWLLAEKIKKDIFNGYFRKNYHKYIYYGIACHMGKWTGNPKFYIENIPLFYRKFAELVHLADYIASRNVPVFI